MRSHRPATGHGISTSTTAPTTVLRPGPPDPDAGRAASRTCHDDAVADQLRYRKDLFRGTAESYDRFRLPYPAELIDDLRARVLLRRTGRLLDLACGTGQIAFALAADFAEVWAVDQEAEMIDFGERKAQRLGVTNIRWIAAAAEDVA